MTIVALGDSTTAGTPGFQSPLEAPPDGAGVVESQYAYWMTRRRPDWRVLNRGIAGERSDQILKRFARDVLETHPQLVVILAGVNDISQGYPSEWVTGHLRQMYEQAMAARIQVVACSILPYQGLDELRRARLTGVNRWVEDYAAAHGLVFCDLFRVVADPAHPWQLAGSPDGLHPDAAGYRAMGEALANVIERGLLSLPTHARDGGRELMPSDVGINQTSRGTTTR